MTIEQRPTHPTSQGKIIQYDYDWIMNTEGSQWVCLTKAQIKAILTMTDYLKWPSRWKAFEEVDRKEILHFAADLERRLMNDCCCDQQAQYEPPSQFVRINDDGFMEVSNDYGDTWEVDTVRDYRFNGVTLPVISASEDDDEEKCFHVTNLVAQLERMQGYYYDAWGEAGTNIEALIVAVIAMLTSLGVIGSWALAVPAILIGTVVTAVLIAGREAWDSAFTSGFWEDLKCALIVVAPVNGVWSPSDFTNALSAIDAMELSIARIWMWNIVRAMGTVGLTNGSQMDSMTEPDCACIDEWCMDFDFTESDHGFTVQSGYGSYSAGVGWVGTTAGTGVACVLFKEFPHHITNIHYSVVCDNLCNMAIGADGFTVTLINGLDAVTGSYGNDTFNIDVDDITLNPSSGAAQGANVTLTRVRIGGTGTAPEGAEDVACGEYP